MRYTVLPDNIPNMYISLTAQAKLTMIKTIHTLIWAVFVTIIGYVLWSGITGNISKYSWLAAAAVIFEGGTLALFKGKCPLTVLAERYTKPVKDNFDIYLPNWLARHNKLIFTLFYCIGLALMIVKASHRFWY